MTRLHEISEPDFTPELLDFLREFEQYWQTGTAPGLKEFLDSATVGLTGDQNDRRLVLEELIKIDIEYRWRGGEALDKEKAGAPAGERLPGFPRLEDYIKQFPELATGQGLSPGLIVEEYRVRQRWGDHPGMAEYAARFPAYCPGLFKRFAEVDAEFSA